jgi:hypothetical protein
MPLQGAGLTATVAGICIVRRGRACPCPCLTTVFPLVLRATTRVAPTDGITDGIVRRGVLHTPSRCIAPPIRRAEIRRVKTRRYWLRRFCNSRATPPVLPWRGDSMLGRTPAAFRVNNVGFQPGAGISGIDTSGIARRGGRTSPPRQPII